VVANGLMKLVSRSFFQRISCKRITLRLRGDFAGKLVRKNYLPKQKQVKSLATYSLKLT
jgi:hypothetical protein